jgi:hypothetical protein
MNEKMDSKQINKIRAVYDDKSIRVYQAYNNMIADEAIMLNKFGTTFSMNRMTWIKPSFLWMMYRSGWGTKEGQIRILAIDMLREGFDYLVKNPIISNYSESLEYNSVDEWKEKVKISEIRIQWDPEKNIFGENLKIRSIQLGIRGNILKKFNDEWILKITEITDYVHKQKMLIDNKQYELLELPKEEEYSIE